MDKVHEPSHTRVNAPQKSYQTMRMFNYSFRSSSFRVSMVPEMRDVVKRHIFGSRGGYGMSGGFLTPKAIANRIKSKGLQKLRWYCQMCEKQCRDENGFKCHATSEGHLRNMQLYAQRPGQFRDKFSSEFRTSFVRELGRRHHTNAVKANSFYTEYIADKDHLHMNATKWRSLTEFILDLARDGVVKAEETEKGWYITWIDTSAQSLGDSAQRMQREKMEMDDAERDRQRTLAQMKAAQESGGTLTDHASATDLKRGQDDGELSFSLPTSEHAVVHQVEDELGASLSNSNDPTRKRTVMGAFGDDDEDDNDGHREYAVQDSKNRKKPMSALEEIALREMERRKRVKSDTDGTGGKGVPSPLPAQTADADAWLRTGIVVKVMNKKLSGGEYYKKKAVVFEVHSNGSIGDVEMIDSKDCIRLPAGQLETVLPQPGGRVLVLLGKHAGAEATLERLNVESFSADVILSQRAGGARLTLPYEAISKIKEQTSV